MSLVFLGQAAKTTESSAQEATQLKDEQAKLRALLDRSVSWIEMFPDANSKTQMKAVPVHRWTNDERDPHGQGLEVLWIHQGRPVASGGIYPWNGRLIHELDSLSRGTMVARRDGAIVWRPETGVKFTPVPNAAPPADSPAVRLRQMKAIADEFAVTMLGWKGDNSDREELRRLTREFFRYKPEQADLLDGIVFAYVKGTDPEALLLLEAVQLKDGPQWQYAFVRQTSGALEARHKGSVVWSAPKYPFRRDPTQPALSVSTPLDLSEVSTSDGTKKKDK